MKNDIFYLEKEYIDSYAYRCGWKATLVYMALCRLANIEGKSFPSIEYLARKLNISKDSVSRGVEPLLKYNIVQRELSKSRRSWGKYKYQLVDKELWKKTSKSVDK